MEPLSTLLLSTFLGYLVNIASNERSATIADSRRATIEKALANSKRLEESLRHSRSLSDELKIACLAIVRHLQETSQARLRPNTMRLLQDEIFMHDVALWLTAGAIQEGQDIKLRLAQQIQQSLDDDKCSHPDTTSLQVLEQLEKAVFSNPVMAAWRHQLSLDYLQGEVAKLRALAEEAAGHYTDLDQRRALQQYCKHALSTWDIIDLTNLPEGDVHIATQQLLLRRLYMPLRLVMALPDNDGNTDAPLVQMEAEREDRRKREAGRNPLARGTYDRSTQSVSVGTQLSNSQRLVVLGDPGGGKTTMLRWLATAYLLKLSGHDAFSQLPDVATLPQREWIPVLIRCRDLGAEDLSRSFVDFLKQHFFKSELLPKEAEIMLAVVLNRIASGNVLLLVDGLDEITDSSVRVQFCQELERTAVRYPKAPILVTSRIVGYRDMPYRMGRLFAHSQIAELTSQDKDGFAERWIAVTEQHQSREEQQRRTTELLHALHSSDRIERLTGNPMLLTTLALVKRKVGKLPSRRSKLYQEAVSVLLNFNPRVYQPLDDDEAVPQLAYLAYEMCHRGVQRLKESEVVTLLEKFRLEYSHLRAPRKRTVDEFLTVLEARSGILIKSGGVWSKQSRKDDAVWEFRHLTFQEFLAARALLDGRYAGRDKAQPLAIHVGLLASAVESVEGSQQDTRVSESWREVLRLLVAECRDDDVEAVLLAIATPPPSEDGKPIRRARAAMAATCLSDEPNVSEACAIQVLNALIAAGDESEHRRNPTSLMEAAISVGASDWAELEFRLLAKAFLDGSVSAGGMLSRALLRNLQRIGGDALVASRVSTMLDSEDEVESVKGALAYMHWAYSGKPTESESFAPKLLKLSRGATQGVVAAAVWALAWMSEYQPDREGGAMPVWCPTPQDALVLKLAYAQWGGSDDTISYWLPALLNHQLGVSATDEVSIALSSPKPRAKIGALRYIARAKALCLADQVTDELACPIKEVRLEAINAIGAIKSTRSIDALIALVRSKCSDEERQVAIVALAEVGGSKAIETLADMLTSSADNLPEILWALGYAKGVAASQSIRKCLLNQSSEVVIMACAALGMLKDGDAVSELRALAALSDSRGWSAAMALLELGESRSMAHLLAKCDYEGRPSRAEIYGLFVRRAGHKAMRLLSQRFNGMPPYISLEAPVESSRVEHASKCLGEPIAVFVEEYAALYSAWSRLANAK